MDRTRLKKCLLGALGAVMAVLSATTTLAQDYPSRPIRVIVPWPAGSPPDLVPRLIAVKMSQSLGQPLLIENRPGAGGSIGLVEFMRTAADGYTLLLLSSAQVMTPVLYPRISVDLRKDLAPIGLLDASANVLVVSPGSPINLLKDLVDMMRQRPGVTFASGGNGTAAHLAAEMLKGQIKSDGTHLPYNNFPQAIGDVITGRVDFMFLAAAAAVPQIRGGKLKPLAVTSPERIPAIKEVLTMRELGFPDFVLQSWGGIAGHGNLAKPIIDRLNAEIAKALVTAEVQEGLAKIASEPIGGSPGRFAEWLDRDMEKFLKLARDANIKAD